MTKNNKYKNTILTSMIALTLLTSAIAVGGIQNAYAGTFCADLTPIPSIDPSEIRETLNPGEQFDITKFIIPNDNECFRFDEIDNVNFGENCFEGFAENMQLQVGFGFADPTEVEETVIANSDAEPREYHCDVIFTLIYSEDFNSFQGILIDVTQPIWITVPEPEPRTIGFWKNHQEQTEEHLPMFIGGYEVVTFDDATDVFNVNAKNAHDMLAAQLLAAEINVWNNVPSCQEVDDAIEAANGTLGVANYNGAGTTDAPEKSDKGEVNAIKDILNQFNNFGCS